MDNPLTPKKIQRLINLAEGRSYNAERILLTDQDINLMATAQRDAVKSPAKYESSSGIIDLDHVEGFGDSVSVSNMSLSKSTAFNPGEMTGRSTGAEEMSTKSKLDLPSSHPYGRHSMDLDSFISKMDKQTSEINEIMRHSIATNTNYSFNSKRDLTADEESLVAREAPLPVMQTTQTFFQDSATSNTSNVSVGAYFKNRCIDFGKILSKNESPDYSNMMPSITEVSGSAHFDLRDHNMAKIDDTLDSVPVRQPRNTDQQNRIDPSRTQTLSYSNLVFKEPMIPKPLDVTKNTTRAIPEKLNPSAYAHKAFLTSSKPADLLLKNMHTSFKVATEDPEGSMENSLSISKIADYLGNQSNVSVTDMMQLNQKRPALRKLPLTELHMNTPNPQIQVTNLIDSKKADTASSAGTVNTVISIDKLKLQDIPVPQVVVTQDNKLYEQDKRKSRSKSPSTIDNKLYEDERKSRSKSPSTKSQSSLSTVRDNNSMFKSSNSPNSSNGDTNYRSKLPSPDRAYKELDKSVDWQEVLQQKRIRQRGAKDHWVEIEAQPVQGFVGVATTVSMSITTLTDTWLSAKFQFDELPDECKDMNIELSRLPLLLSPGKSESFSFHITSNVELDTLLPFTFHVKDASHGENEALQKGEIQVNFKMPVIQAMSADGLNQLAFPPIAEKTSLTKTFILISDCPSDLQIKLLISEGDNIFSIKHVQEIKKNEVNKAILERQSSEEKNVKSKAKMNRQLCRLASSSAISVAITFDAPKLTESAAANSTATFNGILEVTLMTSSTVLRKVLLIGAVGVPQLIINSNDNKIKLPKEPAEVCVTNVGRVAGSWSLKYKPEVLLAPTGFPFKIPNQFDLAPGETKKLQMLYTGPDDVLVEIPIRFEENTSRIGVNIILAGGSERPRSFPIKSNHNSLSWVRAGRKEVSLKNNFDRKVHIRCTIVGEGFSIDLPGCETRGVYGLTFNGCECRPLPIVFSPASCLPHTATLHLAYDRNSDYSRKIKLFGCMGGGGDGGAVRWSGLVTFSESAALVRAVPRQDIDLKLHNKSTVPAFVAASLHFNLQYASLAPHCAVAGARHVVGGRSYHTVSVRVDWGRVCGGARGGAGGGGGPLATLTVLTGADATRRRILRIMRNENGGRLDPAHLPDHLKVLASKFEGEDNDMDGLFKDFDEPKSCLNELIGGLRELTAHIDLPQDFAEENTIIMSDDTILEHHTLCD